MKRSLALLAVSFFAITVCAACGKKSPPEDKDASPPTAAPNAVAPAATETDAAPAALAPAETANAAAPAATETDAAPAATANAADAAPSTAAAAPTVAPAIPDKDIATPTDFEPAAEKAITKTSYKTHLSSIEAELGRE